MGRLIRLRDINSRYTYVVNYLNTYLSMICSVLARQSKLGSEGSELNQVKYAQGKFFPYSKFRIVIYISFLSYQFSLIIIVHIHCYPFIITCSISFQFLIYPIYWIPCSYFNSFTLHILWYILVLGYINSIPIVPDAQPWTGWLL